MTYSIAIFTAKQSFLGRKEMAGQEVKTEIDLRRVYSDDQGKSWVVVGKFAEDFGSKLANFEDLSKEYPTIQPIPAGILPEVIQVSSAHRPKNEQVTQETNGVYFGAVTLDDYIKVRFPEGAKCRPVSQADDHAGIFGHETIISDSHLGIENKNALISGW